MQRKFSYLMLALVMSMLWLPMQLRADDATEVLQPQFGKQTVTVQTGQELTFYDPKGTSKMNSSSTNNTQSLTVFKPAETGMAVQITFETFDVKNDNTYSTGYPGEVRIYNGTVDDSNFTWATTYSGVTATSTLPDGELLETLDGDYTNKTYYSTATDGSLSVGMLWRYAKACEGWVAKVKCVKLENMTVTGAGSAYDNVVAAPGSKSGVALATAYVTANGVLNADTITSVSFKMTKNEGVVDPLSLKLYKGNGSSFSSESPLDATVAASGDGYTFTLKDALESGTNSYTIAGDILSTAAVGAKVQVDVTGVTTLANPTGVSPFTAGTAVEVANPAIVLMTAEDQTITVGDTPLNFYDDGGKDGDVTKNFNGKVIFVPETQGKKVMVNFSMVDIAEGSIYSQYIKIYNGKEASDANLLTTVKKGTTPLVRSTSSDGALTVVFESTTSLTSKGFEATVQQFTPQPMTAEGIDVAQVTDGTVCAGDTDQAILSLNVKTANTEPALTASKFSFTTNGTNAQVAHATLYYTAASSAFATTTKVGETDVTADAFSIEPATPLTLSEGDNYFWLAYNVTETAVNGTAIDAEAVSVTLSDGSHTITSGSPEGNRTVENIVYSAADQGTVTKKVNGSVSFKTKPKSSYSSYHEAGNDDRINVFEPYTEGMVCQIDFSEFNLAYSTSSYGTKSTFKVYSGKGTTGELLWELNSNDYASTGPGSTLRSTAADGALTVVFNPNNSYNYSYKGFNATVSEYQSQPMKVDTVTVSQKGTGIASIGGNGQDVITVNIKTSGNLNAKTLSAMKVSLKGSAKSVSKVSLYNISSESASVLSSDSLLATAAVDASMTEATLSLAAPFQLKEGDNFFRVQYDVTSDALAGDSIDAALVSATVGGETLTAANGDPEGSLTLKNIINLKDGDNGEVLVTNGQNIMFYDEGGADGDYAKNLNSTITFAPKTPGESIRFDFKSWDVTYSDNMYLYNGGSTTGTEAAKYSKYDTPTYFISESADGKVSVKFTSKYSAAGFAIEVSAFQKQPLYVESVKTTAVAPEAVLKGQADVEMVRVDVTVKGEKDTLDITKLDFAAFDESVVSAAKVYATDTMSNYSPVKLFGSAAAGATSVEGKYSITKEGVYKFWLAYDMSAAAAENATTTASVSSITGNGTLTAVETPATATTTVKKGFSGTVTVGAGGDYGTIQAAVDAISQGIEGPVTINIKRGIYNELVNVPHIAGTSPTNTITIQSETGNWNDVKVYYNTYTEPVYSDDKMSAYYGVFTIAGGDYVTLRGLELTTTDLQFPGVLHVKNMSRHLTVDSCYIHTAMSASYNADINLIYTYAKDEANMNNDYLTVRNCLLEGGYIGVRMGGTTYVKLPKEVGGVIENCTLRNQGSKAIYCMDELGAKIRNNRIYNDSTTTSFLGFDGQLKDTYEESMEIVGNVFYLNTLKDAVALSPRQMKGTATAPVIIANNEVTVLGQNASSAAFKTAYESSNVYVVNNTMRMKSIKGATVFYINNAQGENFNVENNILQGEAGEYVYRMYKADVTPTVKFSNNSLFTTGDAFAYDKTTTFASFDEWLKGSGETGSYNDSIAFLCDSILEPAAEGNLRNALPLAFVTTDIAGTPRDASKPTIGAYEYKASTDAPKMADGYPTITNITDSTAQANVVSDMAATAYFVVKLSSDTVPAVSEVLASTTTTLARKGETASATLTGLVKDSEYIAYVVLKSLRGTASEVYPSSKFVAGGEVIKEIPNVKATAEATARVEEGSKATLTAHVTEGTAPFTISWKNGKLTEIATTTLAEAGDATSEYAPEECDLYYLTVTDANGKQATDTCRVMVTAATAKTATFENLHLDKDGFWNGPDTKGTPMTGVYYDSQLEGSFPSGSYTFSNNYSLSWGSWTGAALSNRTQTTFSSITPDQYNSAVGAGYDSSENYAVAYDNGTILVQNNIIEGDSIRGFYITNSAWGKLCVEKGSGVASAFKTGDYFKVIFTGKKANGEETTMEYYLADYRAEKETDHYVLDTWQWVDLRPLGKVLSVSFKFDGSDKGSYGLNTSAYFCMDNFNGERVVKETATRTTGDVLDLSTLFTFDDAQATVSYAFADSLPAALKDKVSLTTDGKLAVSKNFFQKFSIVVSATQKGKIQFLRIPFDITDGINSAEDESAGSSVAGRYTLNGVRTTASQRGVQIVRLKDGTTRKVAVK